MEKQDGTWITSISFLKINTLASMQTVFENSLIQHHVALPPDAMGKITYIAPPGQYSLKVWLFNSFIMTSICFNVLQNFLFAITDPFTSL